MNRWTRPAHAPRRCGKGRSRAAQRRREMRAMAERYVAFMRERLELAA